MCRREHPPTVPNPSPGLAVGSTPALEAGLRPRGGSPLKVAVAPRGAAPAFGRASPDGRPAWDWHLLDLAPWAAPAVSVESVPSEGIGSDVGKDPTFGAPASILLLKHDLVAHRSPEKASHYLLAGRDPRASPRVQIRLVVSKGRSPGNQAVGLWVERSPNIRSGPPVKSPAEMNLSLRR